MSICLLHSGSFQYGASDVVRDEAPKESEDSDGDGEGPVPVDDDQHAPGVGEVVGHQEHPHQQQSDQGQH